MFLWKKKNDCVTKPQKIQIANKTVPLIEQKLKCFEKRKESEFEDNTRHKVLNRKTKTIESCKIHRPNKRIQGCTARTKHKRRILRSTDRTKGFQ